MGLLHSKKFGAAVIAAIAVIVKQYIPGLEGMEDLAVVGAFVAYILAQAFADGLPGKEKVIAQGAVNDLARQSLMIPPPRTDIEQGSKS